MNKNNISLIKQINKKLDKIDIDIGALQNKLVPLQAERNQLMLAKHALTDGEEYAEGGDIHDIKTALEEFAE